MKRLSKGEIAAAFNAEKEKFAKFAADSGADRALEAVSRVLGDLQDTGLDVSLEIFGDASEQAFDLFNSGVTAPISGVLRIGPIHRLFGLATKVNGEAALKIALSDLDIRFNGPEGKMTEGNIGGKVRSHVYDLKNDPEALVKFEQEIIRFAARNAVVQDNDAAQSFDGAHPLRKASARISPRER